MPIDRNTAQYITGNPQQPTQSSAPGIWDIDEQGSAQAVGRWPLPPNVVQRSLRFNSADIAYLNRTPSVTGDRKTYSHSFWVKRGTLGATKWAFSVRQSTTSGNFFYEGLFYSDDTFSVQLRDGSSSEVGNIRTTQVFRDPSAWYHFVVVIDTTQATSSNRMKLYVNGSQVTALGTATYPAQNFDTGANTLGYPFYIGNFVTTSPSSANNFDGYMAEVNFIDGQALTPSSFGQTDAQTGQWIPRVYSGSYGTNGFRLQFLDNSGTTATTLGKDTSGLGNNWTPNNFSVAAGSGNDSLRDVPMNYYSPDNGLGGEVIGNYCTLNPLVQNGFWAAPTRGNLTNGNLDFSVSATDGSAFSTWDVPTDLKIYFEVTAGTVSSASTVMLAAASRTTFEVGYYANATRQINGNTPVSYGSSWTTGDVIGVAVDRSTNAITFYKNGVSQGTITNTFPSQPVLMGGYLVTGQSLFYNFGQRPFAYTAPSGFKALCTQNLPWSGTITTSGTFTGNASTDGPFVYLNGIPTAMTINGNAVTFGTQADKLSNGFKVRSSSASYNASGSNTYSVSTTGNQFSKANAQANP